MAKKIPVYSVVALENFIDTANDVKTVSGVLVIAMSQVAKKQLNHYAFAGLLSKASEKIYHFK